MIKNKSIVLVVVILIILFMVLVACSSSENTEVVVESVEDEEVKGLSEAFAEAPIILTSIGQSADVEMVKALMDNAGLEYTIDKLIKGGDLKDQKTLILAVGGSSKGLGAAGINTEDELVRTNELIKSAKDKDIKIIAMHIGGENRRGELSDGFITPAASNADYIIIVDEGNKDGIFTEIASKNNIPMDIVTSIADAIGPLQMAFK